MQIDTTLKPADLLPRVNRVLELAPKKVRAIDRRWDPARGTPVFTVEGKYTTRGWTEWTQGFQYGSALLCFDGTDDRELLELGRSRTVERMAPHVTHMGVHDHGFNNISTYGNLRRLMREGRFEHNEWEMKFYEMALKASGAVQAARWTTIPITALDEYAVPEGFIHSFNGRHSLFIDTMRTLRILVLAHQLGHYLVGEADQRFSLLYRSLVHANTTSRYLVFRGESQSPFDVSGRTAHEAVFNACTGNFRCVATQQGYSPRSTWTRGLAWAITGFAEQAEFVATTHDPDWWFDAVFTGGWTSGTSRQAVLDDYRRMAVLTADHYINDVTAADGIPYWDDGAPNLHKLGDWRSRPAEPFNDHEPVDSSAAAIAAQGLIRLGMLGAPSRKGGAYATDAPVTAGHPEAAAQTKAVAPADAAASTGIQAPPFRDGAPAERYLAAGLTIARTLFDEPYLSTSDQHEGLILHSVYHRPNGWDHIPRGRTIPCGESSMWGDYHAIELAVLIQRLARGEYMTFFDR